MREIKFRGRCHRSGDWYYGNLYDKDTRGRTHIKTTEKGCLDIDPNTVGQFTGLKDKDGVEIYEGDIIESVFMPIKPSENDQVILGVVEWWAERAEYIVNCNNIDDFDIKALRNRSGYKYADGKFTMSFALKGKVIGNIHDDGELLKGGEK